MSAAAPGYFRAGIILAIVVLILDQASKLALLYGSELRLSYPWVILPFFDLTVVWNRGISYGLFQQEGDLGRWVLAGFKIVAAIILTIWLRKSTNRLESLGLGMIIGGAIGNAIDRIVHGAVFDFIHLHWGTFSWYVFNIADAAIVIGVVFMVFGPLLEQKAAS